MYQVLVFILLLLAQVSHGKTDPLANEEPLYTGSNSSSGTGTTSTSSIAGSATGNVNSVGYDSSSATASTTSTTAASGDCKMDENVLLCLCETKFAGQKELCITAAGQDNVLYAFQATLNASRAANPQSARSAAATPASGIDPALLSLFSSQQQTGGMDMMQMMSLMQLLMPQSSQSQGMEYGGGEMQQGFTGEGQFSEGQ